MENLVDADVDLNMLLVTNDPTNDPTTCWNHLYQSLVSIADKIIPERHYTVNNDLPAWLTPELLNLKKDKRSFFQKGKNNWGGRRLVYCSNLEK